MTEKEKLNYANDKLKEMKKMLIPKERIPKENPPDSSGLWAWISEIIEELLEK